MTNSTEAEKLVERLKDTRPMPWDDCRYEYERGREKGSCSPRLASDEMVELVARALYAARPFAMASTASSFGHQVAKTFDWDGAPAYYQEDMRQLARAALAALEQGGG